MFRRKEDSLFDTATDFNQPADASGETVTVVAAQPTATVTPTSNYTPSSASASGASPATAAPVQPVRPISESRPNATNAATANSFRSSAAPISDMTRNRMPEAKPVAAAAPVAYAERPSKPGARVLTVGNDILLKGEIATCDRLVIEGKVDATLNDVHTVEIAESGSFKGSAQIEDAEISGLFEGDLTVRGRLVIYATGKVRGKISYGEIEIQRGGELTGEIKIAGQATAARPARAASAPKDAKETLAA